MKDPEAYRARNDEIRTRGAFGPDTPNPLYVTPGVQNLGEDAIAALFEACMFYASFSPDEDPYNLHDMGVLKAGDTDVWFKIDPHPEDGDRRVFTFLLPSEY